MKILLIILLISGASLGSYFGYQHYYVETLKLSEIVGHTDDSLTNIAVNFLDFDTGLTRHDLHEIEYSKDYWLKRMKDVESMQDLDLKAKENEKLLAELMEDPTMKKIFKGTLSKTSDFMKEILMKQ